MSQESFHTAPYKPGPVPPNGALRYCIHYHPVDAALIERLKRARVNLLHWHGPFMGYPGLPERAKLDGLIRDSRAVTDQAHAAGMACLLYIGPCFSYGDPVKRDQLIGFYDRLWPQYEDYFGKRPGDLLEMTQRDVDGNPRPYVWEGDRGYLMCVNSPGVRQYTKGLIRMIVESGGDGSFYDGPSVAEGRCHCRWCQAKFRTWLKDAYPAADLRERLGVADVSAVEPPKSAGERLWVPFRRFNAWTLLDFLRDTKAYARQLNPNYIMTSNFCMWDGEPFGPIRNSATDEEIESQIIDIVMDESMYGGGPRWEGGKVSNSTDYRHLEALSRGLPVALLKTIPQPRRPEAAGNLVRLAIAEGAANGANWQLDQGSAAFAEPYHRFLAERENVLTKCRLHATVAVWTSATQAYWDLATFPTAVSRFLADHHIPHGMVIDENVERGKLEDVDVLIVPAVRVISDAQAAALKTWVERGGGLILIGPCGDMDEWGLRRETLPFQQPPGGVDAVCTAELGKGRVALTPRVTLASSPNHGLQPAEKAQLALLPRWIEDVSGLGLPAYLETGDQVEITTRTDGEKTFIVHLLNYGVDLDGHTAPVENLAVRVRLPSGTTAVSPATLHSPDAACAVPVPWEAIRPGPETYAAFTVPHLEIYSQIEFTLRPAEPMDRRGPRLQCAIEGEAAPGGAVTLEAALSPPARATWRLSPTEAWKVEERATSAGRCFVLKLSEHLPMGLTRLDLEARPHRGAALSQRVWFNVLAPFEVSLQTPAFANTLSGRTRAELTVRNRLTTPLNALIELTPPDGWSIEGERALTVPPQSKGQILLWMKTPTDVKPGTYGVQVKMTVGARHITAAATLDVIDSLKALTCPFTAIAPKLDGRLDDDCWREAAVAGNFQRTDGQGLARQQTTARVCHDGRFLYVAFECRESEPRTIIHLVDRDGGEVWRDDSVEVFLDPNVARKGILHWLANVAGRRSPASGWRCATSRTTEGWNVELALPLDSRPQAGDMWGINLCRSRPARPQNEPEYSSWSPVPRTFDHPEAFGVLIFGGQ